MVGSSKEKSRMGWVVTMSGDLEEEILLFSCQCTQQVNSFSHSKNGSVAED